MIHVNHSRILQTLAIIVFASIGSYCLVLIHAQSPITVTSSTSAVGPVNNIETSGSLFYPETYGAKGDGTTDDTAALQKTLNAAAGKGTVMLGSKVYYCGDQVDLPSNTILSGSGAQSVLKFSWTGKSPSGSSPYIQNSDTRTGNSNITLSNFVIRGANDSGLPAGTSADAADGLPSAVRLLQVTNLTVTNMGFYNLMSNGLNLQGTVNVTIVNNIFEHMGRSAIASFWTNALVTKNVTISNNTINYLGDDGIAVAGTTKNIVNTSGGLPTNITITNNRISSWPTDPNGKIQGRGIAILGVTGGVVSGNTITHIPESGILIRGSDVPGQVNPATNQAWVSSNISITNNDISYIGQNAPPDLIAHRQYWKMDGIEIDSGNAITVSGNRIATVIGKLINNLSCGGDCIIQSDGQPGSDSGSGTGSPPATPTGNTGTDPGNQGSSNANTTSSPNQTPGADSGSRSSSPPITNQDTFSGGVSFKAAKQDDVVKIAYYVDGTLVHVATSFPSSWQLDTKKYANGKHVLLVKTYHKGGTVSTAQQTITINNTSLVKKMLPIASVVVVVTVVLLYIIRRIVLRGPRRKLSSGAKSTPATTDGMTDQTGQADHYDVMAPGIVIEPERTDKD